MHKIIGVSTFKYAPGILRRNFYWRSALILKRNWKEWASGWDMTTTHRFGKKMDCVTYFVGILLFKLTPSLNELLASLTLYDFSSPHLHTKSFRKSLTFMAVPLHHFIQIWERKMKNHKKLQNLTANFFSPSTQSWLLMKSFSRNDNFSR